MNFPFFIFVYDFCMKLRKNKYLNLKPLGCRAGMPEWSKGPDSSKNLLLDKNSRLLVDNVCVGSNPTFSIFFANLLFFAFTLLADIRYAVTVDLLY